MTTSYQWPKDVLVALSFTDDPQAPGFELSDISRHVAHQAMWYAEKTGARLKFITVLEEADMTLSGQDKTLHQMMRAEIEPTLEKLTAQARSMGLEASFGLDEGKAWHRLIVAVKMGGHDLVMAAPHLGKEAEVERFDFGSTTQRLLRKCPVPVWVVPPDGTIKIDKVLVPVDFSEMSAQAISIANAFHALTGAERILLHCPDYPGDFAAHRMPDPITALEDYHKEVRDKARAKIAELLGGDTEGWTVLIGEQSVVRVVGAVIEKHEIELVIMGSVARTGLQGLIMGNTAEKILRKVQAPVWVLKPKGWVGVV